VERAFREHVAAATRASSPNLYYANRQSAD
jgi:hypothetical protein